MYATSSSITSIYICVSNQLVLFLKKFTISPAYSIHCYSHNTTLLPVVPASLQLAFLKMFLPVCAFQTPYSVVEMQSDILRETN